MVNMFSKLRKNYVLYNPSATAEELFQYFNTYLKPYIRYTDKIINSTTVIKELTALVSHPNTTTSLKEMVVTSEAITHILGHSAGCGPLFENLINTILDDPNTEEYVLYHIVRKYDKRPATLKILGHPNCGDLVLSHCMSRPIDSYVRNFGEKQMVIRDGLENWSKEWLEQHYGYAFTPSYDELSLLVFKLKMREATNV